jgi:NitT/TauT family transport system substrate-binding protein
MLQIHPLRLFVLASILLLLTACQGAAPADQPSTTGKESAGSATGTQVQSQQTDLPNIGPIKIGYLPTTGNTPIFVAQEKGYFAEQGLEVELVSFQSGTEMIALLSTGHLDLGVGDGGVGMFNALGSELPIKIAAGFIQLPEDNENPTLFIVVRKELFDSGEVVEVSDLAGRKLAMNALRGVGEFMVAEALAQANLSTDDIETVVLPLPEISPALANGAVDSADLGSLLSSWGTCGGCAADLDGNGAVDSADLGSLLSSWGACP